MARVTIRVTAWLGLKRHMVTRARDVEWATPFLDNHPQLQMTCNIEGRQVFGFEIFFLVCAARLRRGGAPAHVRATSY